MKTIVQIRIPKCASTFLNDQLKENVEVEELVVFSLGDDQLINCLHKPDYQIQPYNKEILEAISGEPISITVIRKPIERLFSGLYFSQGVYLGRLRAGIEKRKNVGHASENKYDRLSIEEKIKVLLETGSLPSQVKELKSCVPDFYVKNTNVLNKINLIIIQEKMNDGILKLKELYNIDIKNTIKKGYTSETQYQLYFNESCANEKQTLKEKYRRPLEKLYAKDIEYYEKLKK